MTSCGGVTGESDPIGVASVCFRTSTLSFCSPNASRQSSTIAASTALSSLALNHLLALLFLEERGLSKADRAAAMSAWTFWAKSGEGSRAAAIDDVASDEEARSQVTNRVMASKSSRHLATARSASSKTYLS